MAVTIRWKDGTVTTVSNRNETTGWKSEAVELLRTEPDAPSDNGAEGLKNALAEVQQNAERLRIRQEYFERARAIDPSIESFGGAGQYSGRSIRKSLRRFREKIDQKPNLLAEDRELINVINEMDSSWDVWPNEHEVLRILARAKALAES